MSDKEEQEYAAAFNEEHGAESTEERPQQTSENEAAAQSEEQTQGAIEPPPAEATDHDNDIWANAPEQLRSAYEAERKKREEAEHRVRSDEGRVSSFQRKADRGQRLIETLTRAAKTEGESLSEMIASEDWKKRREEFDEMAPVFDMVERVAKRTEQAEARFEQMDQAEATQLLAENVQTLTEMAPDWRNLTARQDFRPWLQEQPRYVQELFAQNEQAVFDPDGANVVVSGFRDHVRSLEQQNDTRAGNGNDRREKQLAAGRSAGSREEPLQGQPDDYASAYKAEAAKIAASRA